MYIPNPVTTPISALMYIPHPVTAHIRALIWTEGIPADDQIAWGGKLVVFHTQRHVASVAWALPWRSFYTYF